jgi:hypothetical protein
MLNMIEINPADLLSSVDDSAVESPTSYRARYQMHLDGATQLLGSRR